MLFLLLVGIFPVPTIDEYHAARVIEGERIDLTDDPELAARYILDTIANRQDAGWCSSIEDCAIRGYWGYREVIYPKEDNILLARRILGRRYRPRIDCVYAFSKEDVRKLNLLEEDASAFVEPFYFFPKETTFGTATEGNRGIKAAGAQAAD